MSDRWTSLAGAIDDDGDTPWGAFDPGDIIAAVFDADRPEWHARARCRGQGHLFFVRDAAHAAPAKAICATCPVIEQCRAFVLNSEEPLDGVWAGLHAQEWRKRRPIRPGPNRRRR